MAKEVFAFIGLFVGKDTAIQQAECHRRIFVDLVAQPGSDKFLIEIFAALFQRIRLREKAGKQRQTILWIPARTLVILQPIFE